MGGWTSRFNAMTLTSRAAYGSTAVECPLAVGGPIVALLGRNLPGRWSQGLRREAESRATWRD